MTLKYLTFHTPDGIPVPILFSEVLLHNSVRIAGVGEAQSGGYCKLVARDDGGVSAICYGQSTSLGLTPKLGDSQLIEELANGKATPNGPEQLRRAIKDGNW